MSGNFAVQYVRSCPSYLLSRCLKLQGLFLLLIGVWQTKNTAARMRSTGPTYSQNKNEGSEAIRVSIFCYVVPVALYQLGPYQHSAELTLLLVYLEAAVTS